MYEIYELFPIFQICQMYEIYDESLMGIKDKLPWRVSPLLHLDLDYSR